MAGRGRTAEAKFPAASASCLLDVGGRHTVSWVLSPVASPSSPVVCAVSEGVGGRAAGGMGLWADLVTLSLSEGGSPGPEVLKVEEGEAAASSSIAREESGNDMTADTAEEKFEYPNSEPDSEYASLFDKLQDLLAKEGEGDGVGAADTTPGQLRPTLRNDDRVVPDRSSSSIYTLHVNQDEDSDTSSPTHHLRTPTNSNHVTVLYKPSLYRHTDRTPHRSLRHSLRTNKEDNNNNNNTTLSAPPLRTLTSTPPPNPLHHSLRNSNIPLATSLRLSSYATASTASTASTPPPKPLSTRSVLSPSSLQTMLFLTAEIASVLADLDELAEYHDLPDWKWTGPSGEDSDGEAEGGGGDAATGSGGGGAVNGYYSLGVVGRIPADEVLEGRWAGACVKPWIEDTSVFREVVEVPVAAAAAGAGDANALVEDFGPVRARTLGDVFDGRGEGVEGGPAQALAALEGRGGLIEGLRMSLLRDIFGGGSRDEGEEEMMGQGPAQALAALEAFSTTVEEVREDEAGFVPGASNSSAGRHTPSETIFSVPDDDQSSTPSSTSPAHTAKDEQKAAAVRRRDSILRGIQNFKYCPYQMSKRIPAAVEHISRSITEGRNKRQRRVVRKAAKKERWSGTVAGPEYKYYRRGPMPIRIIQSDAGGSDEAPLTSASLSRSSRSLDSLEKDVLGGLDEMVEEEAAAAGAAVVRDAFHAVPLPRSGVEVVSETAEIVAVSEEGKEEEELDSRNTKLLSSLRAHTCQLCAPESNPNTIRNLDSAVWWTKGNEMASLEPDQGEKLNAQEMQKKAEQLRRFEEFRRGLKAKNGAAAARRRKSNDDDDSDAETVTPHQSSLFRGLPQQHSPVPRPPTSSSIYTNPTNTDPDPDPSPPPSPDPSPSPAPPAPAPPSPPPWPPHPFYPVHPNRNRDHPTATTNTSTHLLSASKTDARSLLSEDMYMERKIVGFTAAFRELFGRDYVRYGAGADGQVRVMAAMRLAREWEEADAGWEEEGVEYEGVEGGREGQGGEGLGEEYEEVEVVGGRDEGVAAEGRAARQRKEEMLTLAPRPLNVVKGRVGGALEKVRSGWRNFNGTLLGLELPDEVADGRFTLTKY
ncbi:hypothetical protein K490DRAFT_67007 [Saccharata proteae CBS 121410]|uniref:Uncharacterized protein n=1 Tax=Saccharata proteae CBS 121410 TaxID=1314787 RepID=A0A9P4HT70_9PEZI|nr:hypothetical protein K490DRAFT_67007 [Saccharata proteae CBS 121410]